MKKLLLLLIITIITGCSLGSGNKVSVNNIKKCITDNKSLEIEEITNKCQELCNGNVACQRQVIVMAQETIDSDKDDLAKETSAETINDVSENNKIKTNQTLTSDDKKAVDETKTDTAKSVTETSNATSETASVTLAGVACADKENLSKMKIWLERVDIVDWNWIAPSNGQWEYTDLKPGKYKIYYAPERNTQPLAKYSEFIADGSGNHDYKILDLTAGGEVRGIEPCDWE